MAKASQSTTIQPLTGETIIVPATKRGTKPTMKEPEGKNAEVSTDVQTSGIPVESKLSLIKRDVDTGISIAEKYVSDLARSRVGPDGTWTKLVEGHVYTLADWTGIRDTFKATLFATVKAKVVEANPMPEGTDEGIWNASVNAMTDAALKQPVYNTLVSQFNLIGRFFQKRGEEPPVGREKLLQILKGETRSPDKADKALAWKPVLVELQSVAPASTRGRKRGTTNKDSNAKTGKGPGQQAPAQATPQDVVSDPAEIVAKTRKSVVEATLIYVDKLHPSTEYLVPVMLALANKLKACLDSKELQECGLLLVDYANGDKVAEEEEEEGDTEGEEVTPKFAAGVKRRGGL